MASAVDSGRARHLLQQAQGLAAELRSLPMDPETTRSSFPRMFELARLVRRFVEAASAMPADETRAMWEQRGVWLQEEVAALAEERIHSSDQKQYWLNLVLLLFAGADMCEQAQREKLEVEAERDRHAQHIAQQDDMLREAALRIRDAATAQQVSASNVLADEALELHTRVDVLQAELQEHRAEVQRLRQEAQAMAAERESIRQQSEQHRQEAQRQRERSDSQVEVIQQMMSKSEGSSRQSEGLVKDNLKLIEDNKALGSSFDTNAQVIEKLIELNSELMDNLNAATTVRQQQATAKRLSQNGAEAVGNGPQHQQQQQQSPEGRGQPAPHTNGRYPSPAPATPPVPRAASFSDKPGGASGAGGTPPQGPSARGGTAGATASSQQQHPPYPHGRTHAAGGTLPQGLPWTTGRTGGTPPLPYSTAAHSASPARAVNGSAAGPPPPAPPPAPSFTDAFEAFINAPDPGKKASSAAPLQSVSAGGAGSGAGGPSPAGLSPGTQAADTGAPLPARRAGLLGGAAGVMRFIAGSGEAAAAASGPGGAGGTRASGGGGG